MREIGCQINGSQMAPKIQKFQVVPEIVGGFGSPPPTPLGTNITKIGWAVQS